MNTLNVITLSIFAAVVLLGLSLQVLLTAVRQRPRQRMRERLQALSDQSRSQTRDRVLFELQRARAEARRRKRRESLGSLGYYLNRLDTVAGHNGVRRLGFVIVAVAVLGLVAFSLGLVPQQIWVAVLVVGVLPLLVTGVAYRWLVNRFRQRFLNQMADAMDMIVRASQAGIPVTQSIRNVGLQFKAPLGPEFRRMGDSLLLGEDLQSVFAKAVQRIELPDFTFFSVCVLLQRESGGSIVEALENLSGIIRARRDLQLKAKALTAEGRLSGQMLSAIPFIIVGLLYVSNPKYLESMFTTESGHTLLWLAGTMLVIGILLIRHIANLKV